MSAAPDDPVDATTRDRLLGRLDRMVEAGRVTDEEAQRLRAAANPAETDAAVGAIRARHAGGKLEAAVACGALTRAEADDILRRLRGGDHSAALREEVRAAERQTTPRGDAAVPDSE